MQLFNDNKFINFESIASFDGLVYRLFFFFFSLVFILLIQQAL